jgi:cytoskeletal protein CcmA (bactofilin family)
VTQAPLYGKFRGKVLSTEDPLMGGRLLCEVAALPGSLLNWAMPSIPYAGIEQGFFALPPEGADVWVEFEQGNPDKPIWSGCYWEIGEEPLMPEVSPEAPELITVLRTKFCTLVLNDTPETGGVMLEVTDPAVDVPVTVLLDSAGFSVTVGAMSLTINPEIGIVLRAAEVTTAMTEEAVTTTAPAITLTAEETVDVTSESVAVQGDVAITGPVEVEGPVSVTAAVEIGGALSVEGASEFAGEVNVTGAATFEGNVNVAGAFEVEGESNVLGAATFEGDVNIAGAQEVEGDVAVLGLIEGIIVPGI